MKYMSIYTKKIGGKKLSISEYWLVPADGSVSDLIVTVEWPPCFYFDPGDFPFYFLLTSWWERQKESSWVGNWQVAEVKTTGRKWVSCWHHILHITQEIMLVYVGKENILLFNIKQVSLTEIIIAASLYIWAGKNQSDRSDCQSN